MTEQNQEDSALTPVRIAYMFAKTSQNCPKCSSPPKEHEMKDYGLMWQDDDVHCKKCGAYVRAYDTG